MNERANRLAHHLRVLGVGPEVRVAICVERSIELVVGLLGILKAGGAYVPLDPAYPPGRLAFMLEDAQAAMLLTTSETDKETSRQGDKVTSRVDSVTSSPPHPLTPSRQAVVNLDTDWPVIAQQPETAPSDGADPDNLAYVIYTSGSTGRPKGTAVSHRGCVNLLHWFITEFQIAARDTVLLMTSPSFDLTQKNLFAPLAVGGQVSLLPSAHYDVDTILEAISAQRIRLLNCTPSAFYPLVDHSEERSHARLARLRCVVLGGEPIIRSRLRSWITSRHCAAEIVNTYGPTECSDIAAFYRLDRAEPDAEASVPIGRPIANTQIYLLDRQRQPAPIGVPGELYIGGEGVGRGYLGRPDLTAERFVPNPFLKDEIGRMKDEAAPFILHPSSLRLYKTGDLARYLPEGSIEYIGRIDHQVKVRGYRIELGEIEAMLVAYPGVRECVVLARNPDGGKGAHGPGEKRLVAYIVQQYSELKTQNSKLAHELRAFLNEHLPDYMVPSAFVVLPALPRSPNGKLDRRALPAPDAAAFGQDAAYVAPRTPVEELLAQIWCETLGLARVGIHDNFFALGGHSLLATQVIARLRQRLGVSLPLRSLFEFPTIAGLATAMASIQADRSHSDAPGIAAGPREHEPTIDQLVDEIEQLPEHTVQSLLAKELPG